MSNAEVLTVSAEGVAGSPVTSQLRRVVICAGTGCMANGSMKVYEQFKREMAKSGLDVILELRAEAEDDEVRLSKSGCQGFCQMGPLVSVEPEGILYTKVREEDVAEIVQQTLIGNQVVERLLYKDPSTRKSCRGFTDNPFYSRQDRLVLRECGFLDPEDIHEYMLHGGYKAAKKAFVEMSPEQICKTISESGLRGRGGGGFPTGRKWDAARVQTSAKKYVICNGDEGDPGAFMDGSVLEGDPHAVIEGMLIAARAMKATHGVFYIRAEYPLAVERVEKALRQARAAGLVGKNVMDSGWAFDFEMRLGAGAFVCGEETALIASIEGKRGTPRPRPPFPAVKGLWDQPSCINNVETLANVPNILLRGAKWFASRGTEKSKGTKLFALTGKSKNNGLVEVPMGMTLRDVIEKIGGGTDSGLKIKAIQTGGPSGGMIPEHQFDTPVSYESLQQLGSMMGSGGMIVIDEHDSVVELAQFYLDFCVDESCGKCAPCRIGGTQMLHLLNKIVEGKGTAKDIRTIRKVAKAMQKASLCALGQTAPNPTLSAIRHFEHEFTERLLPVATTKA